MPQLDQFTYFSQFVWLTLSFLVYYAVVVHSSLPKLSRILKSRARFLSQQTPSHQVFQHGAGQTQDKVNDTLVTDCIHSSAHYLHESVAAAQAWCSSSIAQFKHNELVKANRSYLKILSELTVAQVMWKAARAPLSFERIVLKRFTLLVSPQSKITSQNTPDQSIAKQHGTPKGKSVSSTQSKKAKSVVSAAPKSNKVKRK